MSNHVQEPAVEQVRPMGIAARHSVGKFAYPVASVPTDIQTEKVIFYRVEYRYAVGVEIPNHISVPEIQSFQSRIYGDTVSYTAANRTKIETKRVPRYSVTAVMVL